MLTRLPPGVTFPEISKMQARAIFEAAVEVSKDADVPVEPEVMIPLVSDKVEFDLLRERIDAVATQVFQETGTRYRTSWAR